MKNILITSLLVILSVAVFAQKAKRPLTREEYLNPPKKSFYLKHGEAEIERPPSKPNF